MDLNTSSFNNKNDELLFALKNITPLKRSGATSDCYKMRIFGKWHFLKRPKKEFASNTIYASAFEKEFDLGLILDHANIVRYISKGSDADGIYIITEFVDGLTLSDFIQNNPRYFNKRANINRLMLQLLSALKYLHERQIVHMDLKPDNILITNNGYNLKLIDLGLSYSDCYSEITGGTERFGSPEQFIGSSKISYKSDMYAVGNIILFLFFTNIDKSFIRKLPQPYRSIVKQCLIDDSDKRVITAAEALERLQKTRNQVFRKPLLVALIITFLTVAFTLVNLLRGRSPSNHIKTETEISEEIKNRLSPNIHNLNVTFSDINETNIDLLKKLFHEWNVLCDKDKNFLYKEFEGSISQKDFDSIYDRELERINMSIQKRLDEFRQE